MSDTTRTHLKWAATFSIILALIAALWVFSTSQVSTTEVYPKSELGMCNHGLQPTIVEVENSIGKRLALSTGAALGTFIISTTSYMFLYGMFLLIASLVLPGVRRITRKPDESDDHNTSSSIEPNPAAMSSSPEPIAEQSLKNYLLFHLKWMALLSFVVATSAAGVAFVPDEHVTERNYYFERPTSDIPAPRFTVTPISTPERLSAAYKAGTTGLIVTSVLYLLLQSLYTLITGLISAIVDKTRHPPSFNTQSSPSVVLGEESLSQDNNVIPSDVDGRV